MRSFPGLQPILPPRSSLEPNEDAHTLHLLTMDEAGTTRKELEKEMSHYD